jgi:hypothetical protein
VTTICGTGRLRRAINDQGEPASYLTTPFSSLLRPLPLLVTVIVATARSPTQRVNLETMDVIDANAEDVRFLQATRHGNNHRELSSHATSKRQD